MDLPYTTQLLRMMLVGFTLKPGRTVFIACLSFTQSALLFAFWCVFLSRIRSIGGWTIDDMAAFIAINEIAYCLTFILAHGIYQLDRCVTTGEMDKYLVRPRHPLGQMLVRSSSSYGPGGLAFGLLLLCGYAGLGSGQICLALIASVLLAVLIVALIILFDGMIFFLHSESAGESLFGMTNTLSKIPQHTQHGVVKFLLYTVLPAGFIAVTPVDLVRHESPELLGLLFVAAAGYMALALWLFNRGLRRYTSATGWSA